MLLCVALGCAAWLVGCTKLACLGDERKWRRVFLARCPTKSTSSGFERATNSRRDDNQASPALGVTNRCYQQVLPARCQLIGGQKSTTSSSKTHNGLHAITTPRLSYDKIRQGGRPQTRRRETSIWSIWIPLPQQICSPLVLCPERRWTDWTSFWCRSSFLERRHHRRQRSAS